MTDKTDATSVPLGPYLVAAGGFWSKTGVESLLAEREVLLAIAAEYRKTPVSDGRPRYRQRDLLKRLDALDAR